MSRQSIGAGTELIKGALLNIHLPSPERFVQLTVLGSGDLDTSVCPTGCRGARRARGGGHR
jgi:hypothetical protein